jgi:hypothetical protein
MATLKQAGEIITEELHERVDRLVSAVEDDAADFAEIARLADAVGELADTIGETYSELEQALMRRLQGESESDSDGGGSQPEQEARSSGGAQQSASDDVTKQELLERAREVNVHGRSTMDKEELAEAVEAEESVTKEELLERAREAGIEGRSSMSKDQLREALRDAGV